ncbi:MAG: OmpH family outer membrane protein [Alphaproteobacteria bacterium]|nr:OmpH family outer membrane protein [Alphaproteobacteria bacterium]
MKRFLSALAAAAMGLAVVAGSAAAQDYFIPGQRPGQPGGAQPGAGRPAPAPGRPAAAPAPARPNSQAPSQLQQDADGQAPIQAPMPPVPELPALPRSAAPPAAVIGIIGVPEVMRASSAAQQVDKVIGERREKLNDEAQKEQQAWRDLQQALASQRATLSPEQIRTREKELQDRITNAQRSFQNRNRIVQEAAQYGLNQIQASLIAVIRQVAESRGINLVLHRAQVALNMNEFDISDQVAEQLNRLIPTVVIPPEGVSPNAQPATPSAASPAAPKKP